MNIYSTDIEIVNHFKNLFNVLCDNISDKDQINSFKKAIDLSITSLGGILISRRNQIDAQRTVNVSALINYAKLPHNDQAPTHHNVQAPSHRIVRIVQAPSQAVPPPARSFADVARSSAGLPSQVPPSQIAPASRPSVKQAAHHMVLQSDDSAPAPLSGKNLHNILKERVPIKELGGKVSSINVKEKSVVLHFKCKSDLDLAKASLEPKLNNTSVKVRDNPILNPRIIIFNVPKTLSVPQVTRSLCEPLPEHKKVWGNVSHIRNINCKSDSHNHMIFDLPGPVYQYHMNKGSVLLEDWSSCRLAEARRVLQCMHCGGYNHRAADCRRSAPRCLYCAGDHAVSACTNRDNPGKAKCIHCTANNCHRTNSPSCPVYSSECLKVQARITYA
jgi:hypothetical protein